MAWQVVRRVFDYSQHGGVVLLALVALAEWSDKAGIVDHRSIADLADRMRCSEATAKRHVKALRDSGEIAADPTFRGRGLKRRIGILVGLSDEDKTAVLKRVNSDRLSDKKPVNSDRFKRVNSDRFSDIKPVNSDPPIYRNSINNTVDNRKDRARGAPAVLTKLDPGRPFDARVLALAEVCQIDANMAYNRAKLEKAAANLAKYDAETIGGRYGQPNGRSGWNWYRDDWRGQKNQPPTPANVIETIKRQDIAAPAAETAADKLARARGYK